MTVMADDRIQRTNSEGAAVPSPHATDSDTVLTGLRSDRTRGLNSADVSDRLARYGYNQLAEAPAVPLWKKLLGQFKELVIWILIVAAVISGAVGEWADTLAILAIVLMNGIIGFLQEEKAERALAALQKLSAPLAKVFRNGTLQSLPARELVPGDRIELEAGDNIPADARLFEAFSFRVQEASLTGESVPVDKDASCVLAETTPLGDRRNMAYMGTVAAAGKASAVVVVTGMNTELGHIAGMLQRYEPEPTPLQRRLAELGKVLVVVCLVIVAIIFVLQLVRGGELLEMLLVSVSLAVAAVPEGLPAVVTLALALGLQRMVKRNALVRKLPSVETLGSVTVICSDKTGTLTRNEMTVREIVVGGEAYRVTGAGYAPSGEFRKRRHEDTERDASTSSRPQGEPDESGHYEPVDPHGEADLIQALTIATRCNNATVSPRGDGAETWQVIGDPTEGALVVAALKAGIQANNHERRVISEIPFDSERKAMSVVLHGPNGTPVMYTKGAPEVILAKLRQHSEVRPLPVVVQCRRGAPHVLRGPYRLARSTHGHSDSLDQPGDGRPARTRLGHGAAGARHHESQAETAARTGDYARARGAHSVPRHSGRRGRSDRLLGRISGRRRASRPRPDRGLLHYRLRSALLLHRLSQPALHHARTRPVLESTLVLGDCSLRLAATQRGHPAIRPAGVRGRHAPCLGMGTCVRACACPGYHR
jgi:Ca2+-transporting ATPase